MRLILLALALALLPGCARWHMEQGVDQDGRVTCDFWEWHFMSDAPRPRFDRDHGKFVVVQEGPMLAVTWGDDPVTGESYGPGLHFNNDSGRAP